MRDIIQCMSVLCKTPNNQAEGSNSNSSDDKKPEVKDSSGTQTEIVAVHTPQVENLPFPFASKLPRPSTLLLNDSNGSSTSIRQITEKETEEHNDSVKKANTIESTNMEIMGEEPQTSVNIDGDEPKSVQND